MTAVLERIPKPADEADWLALRERYAVTASNIAALPEFDCHPFVSAVDLWVEQTMGVRREQKRVMRRGQVLEPAVARWFAEDCGIELVQADVGIWNGLLLATPDYEQANDANPLEGYEVKTHRDYWRGLPEHVELQCVAQALTRGWQRVLVVEFGPSLDYQVHTVEPSAADFDDVARAVEAWADRLRIGAVPAPRSLDEARKLWPTVEHNDVVHVDDPLGVLEIDGRAYLAVAERIKTLEAEQEARKARLASLVTDHRAALLGEQVGGVVVGWNQRKGATYLDLDALASDYPQIDLDAYERRRDDTRTFTVKEAKIR